MMEMPEDTRTRIITASAELFYIQGFESVGLQKICAQAKVSKSSFYHFFASKDEVAIAVVNAHWHNAQEGLAELFSSPLMPLQKIRAIFDNIFDKSESSCSELGGIFGCPFGNLASELSNSNPALQKQVQIIFDHMTEIYIDLIKQAKQQGEFSEKISTLETAHALVMLMQGISIIGKVYNDPTKMRSNGQYTLNLILSAT
ncbi:MAG: TetR/AcrR family transcriptional regulator [Mariprofundaceae bacterium]